jgi:3-hydroxyisobutyrate dehydrogenase-like beta-hydroxyacid dehydrogenase
MSPPGRPKGEYRSAQHEGTPVNAGGIPVGLIGVGLVGIELARHLVRRGFRVRGFDIDPSRLALLEAAGGEVAASVAEVGATAPRIVLALLDTDVTRRVVEGENGLMSAPTPPRYLVDTSTGDPEAVVALGARVAARGSRYVDATLSGSSAQIAARDAVVMVGGEPADCEACADLFAAFGERVFRLGGPGAGMKAKLASNVILGLNRVVLAEGLAFARALGLDVEAFLATARASPAYSVAMDVKGARMVTGRYTDPDSRVRQHLKDVEIILRYAHAAQQPLPLSEVHHALLAAAVAAGDGDLDNAAILRRYAPT